MVKEKRVFKRKKLFITLAILLFIILLLITFSFMFSDKVFETSETIAEIVARNFGNDKDPGYLNDMINIQIDKYYMFLGDVNVFRIKKNLFDGGLPIYELMLSKNDVEFFTNLSKKFVEQGYKDDESNSWRKVELYTND